MLTLHKDVRSKSVLKTSAILHWKTYSVSACDKSFLSTFGESGNIGTAILKALKLLSFWKVSLTDYLEPHKEEILFEKSNEEHQTLVLS